MEVANMKRHELSDAEWEVLEPIVRRRAAKTGRKARNVRQILNGIMWILRTGAPWRDLPERLGPWQSVYHYYRIWRDNGTFDRILQALQVRLDRDGKIDWDLWCIDGSSVRASRAAAGASKKASLPIRKSPKTTVWAAQEADSAANSIWLLTARACRLRRK